MFKRCDLILALCATILLFSSAAVAQDAVKVVWIQGIPKITRVDTPAPVDCSVGMVVSNGDRIQTAKGDIVEISFTSDNKNIVSVEENSDMFVKKGEAPYLIELISGDIMALVTNLPPNSTFEVKTPAALCGARGTGWRSETTEEHSTFSAFEDSVYTKGIDRNGDVMADEFIVDSGFKTTVDRFEKPGRVEALSEREMERWDAWKEGVAERMKEPETVKEMDKAQGPETPQGTEGAAKNIEKAERMERAERIDRTTSDADRMASRRDNIVGTRTEDTRESSTPGDNRQGYTQ